MKKLDWKEALEYIKAHPTSHDIQVIWRENGTEKVGRLRSLVNNFDLTVTFKTNHEMVTAYKDEVTFNIS